LLSHESLLFSWPSWDDGTQGRSGSLLKGCVCVCVCVSVCLCVCVFAAQDTYASARYKSKCFKWLLSINYKIHVEAREPSCVNWHTHRERERESFNILAHINVQIRHSRGRWIWGQIVSDMLISIPSLKLGASAIKVMGHRQKHQPPLYPYILSVSTCFFRFLLVFLFLPFLFFYTPSLYIFDKNVIKYKLLFRWGNTYSLLSKSFPSNSYLLLIDS